MSNSEGHPSEVPDDPEPPAGPSVLEPAESDTMRRLREAMGRYRHRI
ncbi:hypothetical protein [Kitasatospora mediocidica]|nr:hypothetical protein [Kitasatospora mediocidica]